MNPELPRLFNHYLSEARGNANAYRRLLTQHKDHALAVAIVEREIDQDYACKRISYGERCSLDRLLKEIASG